MIIRGRVSFYLLAVFMMGCLFCYSTVAAYAGELPASRPPFPGETSPLGRWHNNNNGTVTDTTTGLIWLQDAAWGGQHDWSGAANRAAQVRTGNPASLTDCSQTGQWRVPTKDELVALTTGKEAIRSSSPYLFTGVQSSYYWSSTTYAGSPNYAWGIGLHDGYVYHSYKTDICYVWPVRGGQ
ncbi:MAG: DUF1566 domain-containing protein [Deltaproteobacteria bacterium]|nr:DUF1566 domain-containing protein [Deltaproteobacteria bacterium]